jgi:hypothetical protein
VFVYASQLFGGKLATAVLHEFRRSWVGGEIDREASCEGQYLNVFSDYSTGRNIRFYSALSKVLLYSAKHDGQNPMSSIFPTQEGSMEASGVRTPHINSNVSSCGFQIWNSTDDNMLSLALARRKKE